MNPGLVPLSEILRLNTRLVRNCLDGMSEEQAAVRPSGHLNNSAFVAAHLADSRFHLLAVAGGELANPLEQLLGRARSLDDVKRMPTLADVLAAWTTVSHALRDQLEAIQDTALEAPYRGPIPMGNASTLSAIAFLVQHDSYHVGQLSFLRRHAGLPAMKYT